MDFSRYRDEIERLRPDGVPDNLVVLEQVGSTNLLARAVVADYDRECQALPTALFLAFEQTAGRGRLGRSWSSPPGQGVYASRTLSAGEPERLQSLPLLVGVGLCRALDAYLPTPCQLKWPNDLLASDKKIGGILIETLIRPGDCALAVVGFGVNRSQTAADLPHERATSILLESGREVPLARLTWDLVLAVERELPHLGDAAYAVEIYRQRSVHRPGDRLTCQVGNEQVTGSFRGFDENGMLLLDVDGRELRLTAGEVIEG
ncbi:MAG TPA: biotin--[acetyl-CoA-carboxylase] ligase [Thermoanaerobaculia bacterium]|nr:biotin--[acetyl-CoA-carboxylase] ligase [Thermoanaerobaculia bacterium]